MDSFQTCVPWQGHILVWVCSDSSNHALSPSIVLNVFSYLSIYIFEVGVSIRWYIFIRVYVYICVYVDVCIYVYVYVCLYFCMKYFSSQILYNFVIFFDLFLRSRWGRECRCSQQEISTSFHHDFTYINKLLPISLYLGWNYMTYRGFGRNWHLIQLVLVQLVIK